MEIPAGMDAMDLETCEQLQRDEREVLEVSSSRENSISPAPGPFS